MKMRHGILWAIVAMVSSSALAAGAAEKSPVFDIPKIEKAVIDAQADDWGDAGF